MKMLENLLEKIKKLDRFDVLGCSIIGMLYLAGISFWLFFGLRKVAPGMAVVFGAIYVIVDGLFIALCIVGLIGGFCYLFCRDVLPRLYRRG